MIDGVSNKFPLSVPVRPAQAEARQSTSRSDLEARLLERLFGDSQDSSAPVRRQQAVSSVQDDLSPNLGRYVDVMA